MRLHVALLVALTAQACKPESATSSAQDFAFNPEARNFVILAGNDGSAIGSPLGGVPTDIQTWWDFVCEGQPYRDVQVPVRGAVSASSCQGTLGKYEIVYANKASTSAQDLEAALTYVGATMDDDSTLVLAYSGHGSETGQLVVTPETPWAPFGQALASAAKARGKRAARFYFFNDSCFSGKLVTDASTAVTTLGKTSTSLQEGQILPLLADGYAGSDLPAGAGPQGGFGGIFGGPQYAFADADKAKAPTSNEDLAAKAKASTEALAAEVTPLADASASENPAFAQAIVFSAANQNELAGDEGAAVGGTFTARLKVAVEHFKSQYKPGDESTNPSLQRVFNAVARSVQEAGQGGEGQVPQYRVTPECVLKDKFFVTGKPSVCSEATKPETKTEKK